VRIDNYRIPTGTVIVPQIAVVMRDERYFPNADKFDPNRFLDSNGALIRCDQWIPFGIGKRQCLGEGLGRMLIFLAFANCIQRFRFVVPVDEQMPNERPYSMGLTSQPEHFLCSAIDS
jgi:cytochrome P450